MFEGEVGSQRWTNPQVVKGKFWFRLPLVAGPGIIVTTALLLALTRPGTVQAQVPPGSQPVGRPAAGAVPFVGHGAYFSAETHRSPVIDPQVFVKDDAAAEGTGPQDIMHVAGLRPARIDDVPEAVLYNAAGDSLGFTVDKWFGASGTAAIEAAPGGGIQLTLTFKRLVAFGVYSLFRETFGPDGQTFVPIDGDGTTNSFTASVDGSAIVQMTSPIRFTHADAIVLVLHSDAQGHGVSRGLIGINAHEQLIARLP